MAHPFRSSKLIHSSKGTTSLTRGRPTSRASPSLEATISTALSRQPSQEKSVRGRLAKRTRKETMVELEKRQLVLLLAAIDMEQTIEAARAIEREAEREARVTEEPNVQLVRALETAIAV